MDENGSFRWGRFLTPSAISLGCVAGAVGATNPNNRWVPILWGAAALFGIAAVAEPIRFVVVRKGAPPSKTASRAPSRQSEGADGKPLAEPKPGLLRRTPEELWAMFKGLTDFQAQRVIKPLIGQPMEVSGSVESVGGWGEFGSQVTIRWKEGDFAGHTVWMYFRDESLQSQLAALTEGDHIAVRGELDRMSRVSIDLENCQFVESER